MPICRLFLLAAFIPFLSGSASAADGKALFAEICVACHREGGIGTPGLAPPLVSGTLKKAASAQREYAALVIIHGLSGPIKIAGQTYVSAMPPRADLSDEDVAALANYVAQDLNGLGPDSYMPLTAADIAELRKAGFDHQKLREMRSKFGD